MIAYAFVIVLRNPSRTLGRIVKMGLRSLSALRSIVRVAQENQGLHTGGNDFLCGRVD